MANKHNDCRNFVTVDVSKGICRRTGEMIVLDSDTCEHFSELPKCKNCAAFARNGADEMGTCQADKRQPWTYPELIAVTCGMYSHK